MTLAELWRRLSAHRAKNRLRREKERLRRVVVAKHLEKARREPVTLGEVPGEGRFSIRKTTSPAPASATPAPARPPRKEPQQSLPLPGLDGYPYPDASLLDKRDAIAVVDRKILAETGRSIAAKCAEFGVEGEIVEYHPGPVVTTYEFRPAAGITVSHVMSLSEDLALALSAESIRIERLPGRASVGIEVPNPGGGEIISLRDVLESEKFRRSPSLLTLALGKDIHGEPIVDDLRAMPHLLIAGTTGSGKSVSINALLTSILFKARPDEVRLILIDPRMVELQIYEHLPHLITPIIIDPKKAANALKWAVGVMEDRFQTLSDVGLARNAEEYNALIQDPEIVKRVRAEHPDDSELMLKPMPVMVIVVDEVTDIMSSASRGVDEALTMIVRQGHTVGVHLIMSVQNPVASILPSALKSSFLARASFRVASSSDSRLVLGHSGAEELRRSGDMLLMHRKLSAPTLVHGAFVSIQETARLVRFLRQPGKRVSGEQPLSSTDLKANILEMMNAGVSTETIVSYARGVRVSPPLSSDEILDWKRAGIAESVIRATLREK